MVSIRAILVAILVLALIQSSIAGKNRRGRRKHRRIEDSRDKIVDSEAEEKDKKELDQDEPGSDEGSVSKADADEKKKIEHGGFVTDEEEDMEFSDKKQEETHSKKDESIEDNFLEDENSEHDDFPEEDEDWNEDEEEDNEETIRKETRLKKNKRNNKGGDIEDSFLSEEHLKDESFMKDDEFTSDVNESEGEGTKEAIRRDIGRKNHKRKKNHKIQSSQALKENEKEEKKPKSESTEIQKITGEVKSRLVKSPQTSIQRSQKTVINRIRRKHPRCRNDGTCKMILGVDGRCGPMNGMLRCFVAKHCEDTQDCSVGFECLSPSEIKERKAAILAKMVKRMQMMMRGRNSKILMGKRRAGIARRMTRRGGVGGEPLPGRALGIKRGKRETRKENRKLRKKKRKLRKEKKETDDDEDLSDLYNTEELSDKFMSKESENISELKDDQEDDTAEQSNEEDKEGPGGKTDRSLSDERSEQQGGATDSVSTEDEQKGSNEKGDAPKVDNDDGATLDADEPLPATDPKIPEPVPEIEQKMCIKKLRMPMAKRPPKILIRRPLVNQASRIGGGMPAGKIGRNIMARKRVAAQKGISQDPPYLRKKRGCLHIAMNRLMKIDFKTKKWHGVNKENAIQLLYNLFPKAAASDSGVPSLGLITDSEKHDDGRQKPLF